MYNFFRMRFQYYSFSVAAAFLTQITEWCWQYGGSGLVQYPKHFDLFYDNCDMVAKW